MRSHTSRKKALWLLAGALLMSGVTALDVRAQPASAPEAPSDPIVSSEITLSRTRAELRLELANGKEATLSIVDGRAWLDGIDLGAAPRGGELDRSWRGLLEEAIDAPTRDLPAMLRAWEAPGEGPGRELDQALERFLADAATPTGERADASWSSDTVTKLNARIAELEERLRARSDEADRLARLAERSSSRPSWRSPFRHVIRGFSDLISLVALYAVLVGLGFAAVFFGRKYLEGVADTARHATVRSGLVGLAAAFVLGPFFVLVTLALTISVVGIPLLLVWVPLFPLAAALAALLGYMAVGHAAGEALAERRFAGGEFFRRANSYYYILTGIALLLASFIAAAVVWMAGPWLGFIDGMLVFVGVLVTTIAFSVGLGAVLISSGGTRPVRPTPPPMADLDLDDILKEEPHV